MFFDSHCHLTDERLAPRLDEVLERALASGVSGVLNIGDSLQSSAAAREQSLAARRRGLAAWSSAGVHPQNALAWTDGDAARLRALAAHPEVRAVGEIGLDWVYDETHAQHPGAPRAVQEEALRVQLELAAELRLPVVIHNREADERLLQIVGEYSQRLAGGGFHCFGSSVEVARRVLDLGFYLGFTGLVTFKNAGAARDAARFCPLDRLLIETDSPYLAPVPHRGKTNEPAYLPRVAETVAALHGLAPQELARLTTRNAAALFGLEVFG